jgi:hypothetical protein
MVELMMRARKLLGKMASVRLGVFLNITLENKRRASLGS